MPAAFAIPAIIGAAGSIGSSVIASKAAKAASQPSAEEARYLASQGRLADLLGTQAKGEYDTGMPGVQQAMGYYSTLARGNRAQMQAALAPSIAQITDQYRGASDAIDHSTVRGGVRDLAQAEMRRDKAGRLSLLTTGQQGDAYDKLNATGSNLMSLASGSAGRAGDILNNMTGNAANRRAYGQQVGAQTGRDLGGILADVLKQNPGGKKKTGGGVGTGTYGSPTYIPPTVTPIDPTYGGQTYP